MSKTFYITTPIYYPNGEPHLGHVYTTLCADVVARYHRLLGEDVFFLTGTDEHGIKMVKTAAEQGIEPRALADANVAVFEALWKEMRVTHDDFIRTSSDRHKQAVTKIVEQLQASDDIYLGSYQGWYDEGQEEFVTETAAKVQEYKSVVSGRALVRYQEPTYFFRLSKFVPAVLRHIEEHPDFIRPESRRNEVLSKLKQGVEDLSISRGSLAWGIPMPQDPRHVLYVWIDALSNYITALGYGTDADVNFHKFWPADVHLIGKEIMWFHTVYWPAMLLALGLPLPGQVYAHGWWTSEGKKMSKSLGNFIDVPALREKVNDYSLDAVRYYLLRAATFGNDLDWSEQDFANAFKELSDVLGNLVNRTINMIAKYRGGVLPAIGPAVGDAVDLAVGGADEPAAVTAATAATGRPSDGPATDALITTPTAALAAEVSRAYDRLELQRAVLLPIELARAANAYIDATRPFTLAKDPAKAAELDGVLNRIAQACYKALVALLPVLPEKAAAGLAQLNVSLEGRSLPDLLAADLPAGHQLGQASPLFPKPEPVKA